MIWVIVGLSVLMGYCIANAAYYSDILARQKQTQQDLGAWGGWKPDRKEKKQGGK